MSGRSLTYATQYRVGWLRGRPVYWHPAFPGYGVEIDGEYLVTVNPEDVQQITFSVPITTQDGMGKLVADCEANPRLQDAMPDALRRAAGFQVRHA